MVVASLPNYDRYRNCPKIPENWSSSYLKAEPEVVTYPL